MRRSGARPRDHGSGVRASSKGEEPFVFCPEEVAMLAKDQIKMIAQEIDRTADARIHSCDDQYDRQQLWEVVRRASRAIEAVTEMERDELAREDRSRRARYLVSELESALEAARRAKVVMDWSTRREPLDA